MVALDPTLVLELTLGILATAAVCINPKILVAVSVLCILFLRTIAHLFPSPIIGSLDDAAVLLCVLRAVVWTAFQKRRAPRVVPGLWAVLLFVVFGVSSFIVHYGFSQNLILASGAYLAIKGYLFASAVAQFDWNPADIVIAARVGAGVLLFIFVCSAVNLIIPEVWNRIFSVTGEELTRYSSASLIGPFIHPFDLAFASAMLGVWVAAEGQHRGWTPVLRLFLLLSVAMNFLTFRRKDLLGLLAALTAQIVRFKQWALMSLAVLVLPIAIIFAWPEIAAQFEQISTDYLTVNSDEARTVLTIGATNIANQDFPFGAGFGRFASRTAATSYSPEYVKFGYQHVYGLGPGTSGTFLTDTSWPAIIGETGWIGAAAWVAALIAVLRRFVSAERYGLSVEAKLVGTVGIGWAVLTLFQSSGSAAFTSPPLFPFYFGLAGLLVGLQRGEVNLSSDLRGRVSDKPAPDSVLTRPRGGGHV